MSDLVLFQPVRALDRNGVFAPGALARFYEPGTTTPRTVYTDSALSTAHPTPLVADASGVFAAVYTSGQVKAVVTDADGVALPKGTMDPAFVIPAGGAAADSISFDATANVPFATVQTAIVGVDAAWRAAIAASGLGVTGSATLLASLDATSTASGVWRFDETTTGTRPSDWASDEDGVLLFLRQTITAGLMLGAARADGFLWARQLTASAWGAWYRVDTPSQAQEIWNAGASDEESKISAAKLDAKILAQTSPILTFSDATATTSGVTHTISGIPSTAREVEIYLREVAMSASPQNLLVQVVDTGTTVTSGYKSAGYTYTSVNGFIIQRADSSREVSGIMRLVRTETGVWVQSHSVSAEEFGWGGGGSVTGITTLTGITLVGVSGGTFTGGSLVISWR